MPLCKISEFTDLSVEVIQIYNSEFSFRSIQKSVFTRVIYFKGNRISPLLEQFRNGDPITYGKQKWTRPHKS